MTHLMLTAIVSTLTAMMAGLVLIPLLIRHSGRLGLMDKPGYRKVHIKAIPVIGGIAIALSVFAGLMISGTAWQLLHNFPAIIGGSLLLFVTGIWDDRKNLRPVFRLAVQLLCAATIAATGTRLSSLYGLFGMDQLTVAWQYILTIVIITGVTNAFNLMDGIDGLAGGLALLNLLILSALSFVLGQYSIFILLLGFSGAIVAFLKNNIQPAKIFMGDGGSLMLGFVTSATGILLIETAKTSHRISISYVVLLVSAILIVPVFDSLRVYTWRLQRGESPFKADKTHLHHLFLILGLTHKKAAFLIYGLEALILLIGFFIHQFAGISLSIVIVVAFFLFICQLLQLNYGVDKWTKIIRQMEQNH